MQPNSKLATVVDVLQKKGYSHDEITSAMEEIARVGFENLYAQAMAVFEEEDIEAIADCPEEEAQGEVMRRFEMRSGRNAEEVMNQFLELFAETFLQKIEEEKN